MNVFTITSEVAVPGPGLFGGYPSSTNAYRLVHGARALEAAREGGRMPASAEELGGEVDWVPAKSFDRAPTPEDVWIFAWAGSSGYGDPIEREPDAVAADVAAGRTTREWAERAYGVVLDAAGSVDAAATEARRAAIRRERLGGEPESPPRAPGPTLPLTGSPKAGAIVRDLPLTEGNPNVRDPSLYTDQAVAFRQFVDPATGTLVATELAVDGAPPQEDVRLDG